MKNIHVLPTDKPSRLYLTKEGFYFLLPNIKGNDVKFQHMYITSDEEIKEGDWFINSSNQVAKCNKELEIYLTTNFTKINKHKIILATDQDLINDGVQAIQDDFLEWFVKNPSCQYGGYKDINWDKIITLKEQIISSEKDAKIFVDAINNPPEPNDELKKAFKNFK